MCNIAHFFGEDVADVVLARDVKDFDGLVLNPLSYRVLSEFYVSESLGCHVPCPLDTCTIVFEHVSGSRDIAWNRHVTSVKTAFWRQL